MCECCCQCWSLCWGNHWIYLGIFTIMTIAFVALIVFKMYFDDKKCERCCKNNQHLNKMTDALQYSGGKQFLVTVAERK